MREINTEKKNLIFDKIKKSKKNRPKRQIQEKK